jgi:hypothetical protein
MFYRNLFLGGLFTIILSTTVFADERHFTYSYEADSVLPKGHWEFEQWLTLKAGKADGEFYRWDFREEMEYGITDRLTTALYLNFSDIHSDGVPGLENEDSFEFEGVSSEWKYMLLSPHLYPIGVLLYFEATYAGEEVEIEEKLILQHNFGERWILAANIIGEQEWEFEAEGTESEGVLEFTAGLSYSINEFWSVGLEGRNHREYPEFEEQEHSAFFLGPNIHYGNGKWWATLTVLPQIAGTPDTDSGLQLDEHERVEVRLIAGVYF